MNKWTIKKKAEDNNNELEKQLVERLNYTFTSFANNGKHKNLLQEDLINIIKNATNTAIQNFINVYGNDAEKLPFYYITFSGKALGKNLDLYATSIMDVKKFKTEEEAQKSLNTLFEAFPDHGDASRFQIEYCANKEDLNKIKIL